MADEMFATPPLVSMTGICKSFGANRVLHGVDFEVRPGEVHALLGENGAGKSTLMKILLGVHGADQGEIRVRGEALEPGASTRSRLDAGVAMIFQELSLVPAMTVADNIFLGREPSGMFGRLDKKRLVREARQLIADRGFSLSPDDRVESLPFSSRQQVEILKALSRGASVIIMDEPTSSLTVREEAVLHETVYTLRSQGIGIVFISHRMAEIFQLADRISIIKDGVMQGPFATADIGLADVARRMSRPGRAPRSRDVAPSARRPGTTVLDVRNLATGGKLRDISFSIRAGEIVGLAGLVGSGRTTLAQSLFGLHGDVTGAVTLNGRDIAALAPARRIEAGLAMVPEDRRAEGLVAEHSVSANMALPNLADLLGSFPGVISGRKQRTLYLEYRTALGIASSGPSQPVSELSGGNQQKVVFAKWLAGGPKLLILDEPTSGVDINAKAEMRDMVRRAAAEGLAILLITSELDELADLSDRLLYMIGGRLAEVDPTPRPESDIRQILQQPAYGADPT